MKVKITLLLYATADVSTFDNIASEKKIVKSLATSMALRGHEKNAE